ncbi:nitronate monooxygenase [Mycobacterium sp. CBMA293]|uniref:NAD(P)H-dependent flavin oxidoreductase n=1 Tax=unclassified Mycolicibacterium TaxID=2636767 RepID=UPI0012DF2719|nr:MULTISPECIES: nitronate monooxygenase [unclassified Mycolicibacterium]MUL57461.1 nitronate monooxygenase [Mycolicibacterium sp. CBMA 335]MUL70501.1 nitronate monooxygenase [Mycolicibacterium sp. CBMA 311]MUL92549.1 nitronate monooxygenase [Mycolicibacterium sp. CBMA 230]MUM04925.1 2-nitropropane dioxygenase [Mycolicibacterium sp. CBMA 213]MUM12368.1 nitronate monooxygenase [Mycolicibacterium sp. CBMA 293]
MALHTPLTELFGIEHPIVLAPMGDVSGGLLAAAVSEGGGLGLIGGGRGDLTMLATECALAKQGTEKPWGVGLLTWAVNDEIVDWVIAQQPAAIMLSFGDPAPFAKAVHGANIPLLSQVHTLDEAKQALDAGVQVLVAQGREAGGHHGGRSTLPFVPAVVDLAHDTPVLAAGGIADGRGLAAALALGAAGAMIGTRFEATHESLLTAAEAKAMLKAKAEDTTTGRAIDIAVRPLETRWPSEWPARTLRSVFTDEWQGRDAELDADPKAQQEFRTKIVERNMDYLPIWAGEALDLIDDLELAAVLVKKIADDAERALNKAHAYIR